MGRGGGGGFVNPLTMDRGWLVLVEDSLRINA